MKHQALFSLNNKSKKIKVSSAAIFIWCFKGLDFLVLFCFHPCPSVLEV